MPDGAGHPVVPPRAPDLLFEVEREARLEELRPVLREPARVDATTPLHRVTVFLTYRCNLACPYCKTIARTPGELRAQPRKGASFDAASFERLLDQHRGTPLRHLHFTGGEAASVPGLAALVRLASARGVGAVSLTTNGTLAPRLYVSLVDAGLTELRVSLDAADAALGEALTLRPGAFGAAARTLEALRAARRTRPGFSLIINTVVGLQNRHRLPEILAFLLRFRPDDVKLITEVDARDTLGDFPEAPRVRARLDALIDQQPPWALPLLRRKLRTVFATDAIGLPAPTPGRRWRCFIPLTERTVDATAYYPCSVYLREGGAPLGPLTDSPQAQREKCAAFVEGADCTVDPICRRYCLHCTRGYNDRANEVRDAAR